MYAVTRDWTSETVELGRIATRAPSRAALVRICHVWYARPNSKMLTDTRSSSGSVSAVSNRAVPRSEPDDECRKRSNSDRRSVGESVVRRPAFDFSNIAPSGSHEG